MNKYWHFICVMDFLTTISNYSIKLEIMFFRPH